MISPANTLNLPLPSPTSMLTSSPALRVNVLTAWMITLSPLIPHSSPCASIATPPSAKTEYAGSDFEAEPVPVLPDPVRSDVPPVA